MKFLAKTDRVTRERINQAIIGLTQNPPNGDIKAMEGYTDGRNRLRVGKYRLEQYQ